MTPPRHDPDCPWMFQLTVSCADLLHAPCGQVDDAHIFPGHPCECSLRDAPPPRPAATGRAPDDSVSCQTCARSTGAVLAQPGVRGIALEESGALTEYLRDGTTCPFRAHLGGECPTPDGCALCRFLDIAVPIMRAEHQHVGDRPAHDPLCPRSLVPQTVIVIDEETGDPSMLGPHKVTCRCEEYARVRADVLDGLDCVGLMSLIDAAERRHHAIHRDHAWPSSRCPASPTTPHRGHVHDHTQDASA